ncbi:MAG: tyrosine-type recombinase/integrase, partial [Streptosporangiales bacterium]
KAVQELLGHDWLSTTTRYVHVHANHIETAWAHANKRVADRLAGRCLRVGDDALRSGLATAVGAHLPAWKGRLTPHVLRHYCASSLYARGVDLKAVQELLGHDWLSTTTRYVHVHANHIETAWAHANKRVADRLATNER